LVVSEYYLVETDCGFWWNNGSDFHIRISMFTDEKRDHLFISYAWEDANLAEWLSLKLISQGYKVWCDQIKLLGGESYPSDIDNAIKNNTFRVLATSFPLICLSEEAHPI